MLYDEIEKSKKFLPKIKIPTYITENLKYDLYEWQKLALENFLINEHGRQNNEVTTPNHLMFNMATGSGKTLVMAALILYYYKQGYKNFLFFVNQNAILGKTQDNFINKTHNKYLFKENIIIDDKIVNIKEVEMFSKLCDDIQIKFTSIHKLHNDIYKESENSIILSDLEKLDIVMIGDEAHHLNATTNKKKNNQQDFENISFLGELKDNAKESDVEKSWETTVTHYILNKEYKHLDSNKNVLLEFTATIPETPAAKEKYEDKIIIKFDLKEFVLAGCTKNIRLLRSPGDNNERIIQALLLNWYRSRIAIKYNIPNFKQVILFRSKTIEDSKKDFNNFINLCKNITPEDLSFITKVIKNTSCSDNTEQIFAKIYDYIQENSIPFGRIVEYIKDNFTDRNCLITNSKTNKTKKEKTDIEQDKLLNSLENIHNPIKAVFTVQRLTEGWDVLNLYDIVRLYHGRDKDYVKNKVGTSTTSEVQLIGRGVRYNPFKFSNLPTHKRKFDQNLTHEARILEDFYFHSDDDIDYLSELSLELKQRGLIPDTRTEKTFKIKDSIKSQLNNMYLWVNNRIENPNRRLKKLPEDLKELTFEYKITELFSEVWEVQIDQQKDNKIAAQQDLILKFNITLKQIPINIVQKAFHKLNTNAHSYFSFENLRKRFSVETMNDFIDYLNTIKIRIFCSKTINSIEEIEPKKLLKLTESFLTFCQFNLEQYDHPYLGNDFKLVLFNTCFPFEKTKMININENKEDDRKNLSLETDLKNVNWYALDSFWGTSEERELIDFIRQRIGTLEKKYDVLLLRNEEVYTIFDFDTGNGFQPDFLLLLKEKTTEQTCYFQVFIEPKGKHLIENDIWKENFLKAILNKYGIKNPIIQQSEKYLLFGLPFFNKLDTLQYNKFESNFNELLN